MHAQGQREDVPGHLFGVVGVLRTHNIRAGWKEEDRDRVDGGSLETTDGVCADVEKAVTCLWGKMSWRGKKMALQMKWREISREGQLPR